MGKLGSSEVDKGGLARPPCTEYSNNDALACIEREDLICEGLRNFQSAEDVILWLPDRIVAGYSHATSVGNSSASSILRTASHYRCRNDWATADESSQTGHRRR
jgi:hypothetical protein